MIFPAPRRSRGADLHRPIHDHRRRRTAVKAECPAVSYVTPAVRSAGQIVGGPATGAHPSRRGRGLAVRPVLEPREGRLLRRFGGPVGRQGGRPRATVANALSDGNAVDQMIRIKNIPSRSSGSSRARAAARWARTRTTRSSRLHNRDEAPETHDQDRHVHGVRLLPRLGRRGADRDRAPLRQRHRLQPGQDSDFDPLPAGDRADGRSDLEADVGAARRDRVDLALVGGSGS